MSYRGGGGGYDDDRRGGYGDRGQPFIPPFWIPASAQILHPALPSPSTKSCRKPYGRSRRGALFMGFFTDLLWTCCAQMTAAGPGAGAATGASATTTGRAAAAKVPSSYQTVSGKIQLLWQALDAGSCFSRLRNVSLRPAGITRTSPNLPVNPRRVTFRAV